MKYKPGTILCRNKGLVVHYGNYLSNNTVLHTRPGLGCKITSLEEFGDGQPIWALNTLVAAGYEGRVTEVINRSYDLVIDNCQHIATYVASGVRRSPQVTGAVVGAAVLTVFSDEGAWWQRMVTGAVAGVMLSR